MYDTSVCTDLLEGVGWCIFPSCGCRSGGDDGGGVGTASSSTSDDGLGRGTNALTMNRTIPLHATNLKHYINNVRYKNENKG